MAITTFIPSSYDQANSNHAGTDSTNTPSNGLTAATSETRAAFTSNTTANSTTSIYYNFDCSSIPQNVTINSVSCDFKATASNSVFNTRVGQLCTGTTKKGSGTTITNTSINNTVNVQTISNTGSWTRAELNNIKILIEAVRGTSTNAFTISFYGATLTVDYTINGEIYDVTSVLSTNAVDSINPAGLTEVIEGDNYQLEIHAASLDDFKVEDNGVNVTSQLVQHNEITSGTINAKPETTPTTEVSVSGAAFYTSTSSQTTARFSDAVGHTAESPATMPSSNQWQYVKGGNNNNATGWAIYDFDFSSIPANATITSVSVKCYGAKENTNSGSQYQSKIGLYSGTTLKSTEQQFTSTSASIMTISSPGTWTRAELQNAKLRFTVAYYGGWLGGVTWTVNYTVPSVNPYYWTYSLSNVAANHTIIISDAIIEIPEEDPQYEYYPITISSINATTDPGRGTIRIVEGTDTTITIYPDDPLVTLITDNGVDVSSQLVQHGGTIPDPTIATASGASYGFTLNSSTGYYVSNNTGISKTAAVCRVTFNLPVRCLITIQFINYAEETYDFGVFGNIDVPLSTNYYRAGSVGATISETSYKLACNTSTYNTSSQQTLTYEIPSGEHFIDIKYSKDDASDSNNDTLQWKILSIEPLEANNYYTYTLSNINQEHSLIFIFGDVTYYFVNSSINGEAILYPNGSMVVLPGDNYSLTIVPKEADGTLILTDNNVDRTSQVQTKTITTTKDGQEVTVTNYIYSLTNVQATHNISVTYSTQSTYEIRQVNNSSDLTISPSGNQEVDAGDNYTVNITTSKPGTITVTDSISGSTIYNVSVYDVSGGSKTVTHTLTNIRVSKTLTFDFTELTKYNVTASENSSYLSIPSGYTSQSVYSGQSCSVKFTSTAPGTITISDNGTNTNYPVTANSTITHTISSVTAAHTVTATFTIASYTVTTSLKSGSKSVTINPASSNVNYNSSYTVTLTPSVPGTMTISEGSTTLQTWTIPVGDLSAKTYTVNNITAAHTYTVNLTELTKYTVSASENSTYLSIPSGYTSQSIYSGQSCEVKFTSTTPGTITVSDNGISSSYQVTSANQTITHTINSVTTNHTITATFSTVTYNISASLNSDSSSVTLNPSGTQSIGHGNTYTLSMTPSVPGTLTISESSTTLETWTIPVGNLAAKTYTVENITSAHTYIVNLTELTKYTVTASESSEYLSIPSGYTSQSIYSGQSCNVKFTSTTPGTITVSDNGTNTNYTVTVNETITHTITSVTAAHTVTATFTIAIYSVSALSSVTGVTLTPASQTITYGGNATITIKSTNPGTVVITDNGTDSSYVINVANGTNTHNILSVTAAHTITVKSFTLAKYTVTATNGSNVTSVSPASQSLDYGSNVSLNVTPTVPGTLTIKETNMPYDVEIEYLKTLGNGDCYIDIPLIHNASFKREFEFKKENTNSKYDLVVQSINNTTSFLFWSANTATFYTYYSGKEFNFNTSVTSQNKKVKVTAQQPNITVDINGSITNKTFSIQSVYTSNIIRLFSERTDRNGIISIYYFKIWDEDNNILLDLIPVRVGTVGYMYDKVSGRLFGNSGTGNFTLGPDVDTSGTLTIYEQEISPSEAGTSITCSNIYTNLSANHSVTASVLGLDQHTITVTNNSSSILSYTPSSPISIYDGETLTINFVPTQPGTLTVTDSVSSSNNQTYTISISDVNKAKVYTIANVTADRTITANLTIATYTVTASSSVTGVTLTPASQTINHNGNTTITVKSTRPGTVVITDNGTDSSYTINAANGTATHIISSVTAAHTVTVKSFTIASYTVTMSKASGSSNVTINPASTSVNHGSSYSVTLTPSVPGTMVVKEGNTTKETWTIPVGNIAAKTFTVSNITAAHTYTVTLTELTKYNVSVTNNASNVTVTPSTTQSIYSGQNAVIQLKTTKAGTISIKDSVSDNTTTLTYTESELNTNKSYTLTNVTAAHTLTITFADKTYQVSVSEDSEYLTITSTTPSTIVSKGTYQVKATVSIPGTVTLKQGNTTLNTQTISSANGTYSYNVTNIVENKTLTLEFNPTQFTVTAQTSSSDITIVSGATYTGIYGTTYTLQYKCSTISTVTINKDGSSTSVVIGSSDINRTKTYTTTITGNHEITLSNSLTTYDITGSISSGETYIKFVDGSTDKTTISKTVNADTSYTIYIKSTMPGKLTVTINGTATSVTLPQTYTYPYTYSQTIDNILEDKTITLGFDVLKYNIDTESGTTSVIYNQPYKYKFTPTYAGTYKLYDNDSLVQTYTISASQVGTEQSYTISHVTSAHSFSITSDIQKYTVSVTNSAQKYIADYSVSKSAPAYHESSTISIMPRVKGTINISDNGTNSSITTDGSVKTYTISNIEDNHDIILSFTPGTYTVTIVNNIPNNYDLTLSKAAGNHNVTACENFTLILTVNSGSKDTMNGKINISSTAGNASYGVVMDTHMSRTYTINEILQNITITLSFEESDMAPIVGNKFLKAFETRSKQQEYVAENNTNPLISFITTTSEVDYTSHYGDMRYVNTEYRDGNADNLFKR